VVVVVLECGRKLVINHFVQESWVGAPTLTLSRVMIRYNKDQKESSED